ncbi:hypothetical protein CAEBREN_16656 [Caenorhabditis brenneri]|uniref:F-box associated domain-containing protein n=1 Tax=Caenorhabditis brenneri TaxID=135651 RepID=G0PJ12_CAEBE|nr:hypothetical protein CAEBREN_16656 [Caenorhabditis brenneri]
MEEEHDERSFMIRMNGITTFPKGSGTLKVRIGNFEGNILFRAQVTEAEQFHFITYDTESEKEIRTGIVDHVSGILRHCPPIECQINVDNLPSYIPDLGEVELNIFEGKSVDADFLSSYFSNPFVQKTAWIQPRITGTFQNDSKFFEIQNIICAHSGNITSSLLDRFTGRNLNLTNAVISSNEVVAALRKWTTGESLENLKTIYLHRETGLFNLADFLNQLEFKPWDPETRPKMYTYIGFIDYRGPVDCNCEHYLDIVRETDKKIGSIQISDQYIYFVVWP